MSKIQIFENKELNIDVRTMKNEDGSISINAEDTARGFGFTQVKNKKEYVRWETLNAYCKENGFSQLVGKDDYIPESLFYLLGMKANNDGARKFQKWLAVEVIPSIRKNGMYATDELLDNPDLLIAAATKLKEEREKNRILNEINEKQTQIIGELQPRADYTDKILKNTGLVTISQIAKDYGMSGQALNKMLHELKVQYKQSQQWLLYRNYQDKGYTFSDTKEITRSDGRLDIKMTTKWTQKGRLFIYELLKTQGVLPTIELS